MAKASKSSWLITSISNGSGKVTLTHETKGHVVHTVIPEAHRHRDRYMLHLNSVTDDFERKRLKSLLIKAALVVIPSTLMLFLIHKMGA